MNDRLRRVSFIHSALWMWADGDYKDSILENKIAKEKRSTGIDFGETHHLTVKCTRLQVTIPYHPQLLFLLLVPHCETWLDSQILPNILEIPLTRKIKTYTSKQLGGSRDDSENKRQLLQWSQWLVLRHENKQINEKCYKKKIIKNTC